MCWCLWSGSCRSTVSLRSDFLEVLSGICLLVLVYSLTSSIYVFHMVDGSSSLATIVYCICYPYSNCNALEDVFKLSTSVVPQRTTEFPVKVISVCELVWSQIFKDPCVWHWVLSLLVVSTEDAQGGFYLALESGVITLDARNRSFESLVSFQVMSRCASLQESPDSFACFHYKEAFMEWKCSLDVKGCLHGAISAYQELLFLRVFIHSACYKTSINPKM